MDNIQDSIQTDDNQTNGQISQQFGQLEYQFEQGDNSRQIEQQPNIQQGRGIKSREQSNNQTISEKANVSKTFEYQVKLSNYSYLEKVIEKIKDKAKFKQSMKGINFFANFTQAEFEEIQEQYGKEENYPVILEKNNKDQIRTIEFGSEKQACMQHIDNKYLKERKANEEIEYELKLKDCQIDIKNKKMNQSQFQSLCQEIIAERNSIVLKEIPLIKIFTESSNFFTCKDTQIKFFSSPFIQYITKQYNLITLRMKDDKNSSKLSVSFSSESESENEQSYYRNFQKFSHESKLVIFGLDKQDLDSCFEHLKNYTTQPVYLDFSDLTNIITNQSDQKYNAQLIKTKIQVFKKSFYKQFQDMLRESEHTKGLRGEEENDSEKSIRYRFDGDIKDIQQIEKLCQEKIQSINGKVFSTQYNDQFVENYAKSRISNIVEKIKESNTMIINKLDEATIFMFVRSPESNSEKEINNIIEQLDYISRLTKTKLQPDISSQLLSQIDQFKNQIESEKNKYCQIEKVGRNINLTGTLEQIENTKKACEEYITRNIQQIFQLKDPIIVNYLTKNIFIKYFQSQFQNEYPDFEVTNQNSLQYNVLDYKITLFNKQEVNDKLIICLKEIGQKIQESVVSCTQNQFQILQKETQFLSQIQQKFSVEIIADPKRLSDLGHTVKDLEVNSFHVKQQLGFSTVNPKLQVCLLCADIQNVHIDSLMINMKINGNYIDTFSPQIVNQTQCGKFVIQEINQINAGTSKLLLDYEDSNDDDDEEVQIPSINFNHKKRKNLKKKFQYFSVSHLNTNFPIKHICISVLKDNKSNIKHLLKKFFQENENNTKVGIIIPNEDNLDVKYIECLREILYNLYGRDQNKEQRQKNIFLFCEESQIQVISNNLLVKGNNQLVLNRLSEVENLFKQNQKQYFINQELVPHEFHLLLDSFTIGKNKNQERFYAFLPKKVDQEVKLQKVKICISNQDYTQDFIVRENSRYSLQSYLDNSDFQNEDIDDIKKAIQKAREQKIESLYLYDDQDKRYQSELVRVNVKKRKIVFQRNKKQFIEYQDKDIQQDQKLNFLYIIRGYNQEDIKEAQNQLNSKLFINLKYFKELWDYNYVDENVTKLLTLSKNDQYHKKTIDSFEKIFRKKQLKILEIQFIQNIVLYQKFQEQVIQLHNKCKTSTEYQEAMFYNHTDDTIFEKIFKCNSIGFDPRVHNNCFQNTNRILLENRPGYDNNSSSQGQCLACFVVKGKVLKQDFYSEQFKNLKRLPKDDSDNQFYDCAQMEEEDEEVKVAIFDLYRVYPAYLIKFQKNEESETNYTTDDQSRKTQTN
ncbi:hypothetical protein ABPG72_000496 [Tetrahymena utriculariae]